MRKRHSFDKVPGCSIYAALNLIGGRWKGVILYYLRDGTLRFNEISRHLTGCSQRQLVKQLRELEEGGFVLRTVYPVVPPKVEYALTEEAKTMMPLLLALNDWGEGWLHRRGLPVRGRASGRCPPGS